MAIVRWDPFREMATMQDRINRMFGDVYRGRSEDDVMARGAWMPPVDIYENGNHEVVLKAEVPGLKKEDVDIRVENSTLTIRGERKRENEVNEDNYHRVERSYGMFSRSFVLPATIDANKVRADYKDGVLTVTLPIREEAKPKQVQVQIG